MKSIITVLGARPQFIKAAAVSRVLGNEGLDEAIVHTGQHFDSNMSDVFFDELQIPPPAYNLGIGGGRHGENTGRMIEAIERVLLDKVPDLVIVYGDTDSTLAAALAAVKLNIPIAHIEAGLRSFNRTMPEEINRVLTDHVATLLFAPTKTSVKNLVAEGIERSTVKLVGDVMYDAALFFAAEAERRSDVLARLGLSSSSYVLATIHRAENTDNAGRLNAILDGFASYGHPIVLPLHPRTRDRIAKYKLRMPGNVRTVEPLGYLDMVMLEKHARLIATDSGGVQKEAFFYRVPCVTIRDETEWIELVEAGWNRVARPSSAEHIADALVAASGTQGTNVHPYGTGHASVDIVRELSAFLR